MHRSNRMHHFHAVNLPTDPIAVRKIPLKLSDSLLQHIVADVNAQEGDVPEIGPLLKVHFVSPGD